MNRLSKIARRVTTGLAAIALALAVPLAAEADVSHAQIKGSGSSWASNAIAQWQADVTTNGGLHVDYNPDGAALGRSDFAHKLTDFGVSDIGYQGTDPDTGQADTSLGRAYAYLPIAAGGTALPYHVEVGGTMVRNLRLSGQTVAKIFTGQITNWNDAAITADNNGVALPSIPIIPVVHSEGAGVTYQFTRYLATQFPAIWGPCNGGKAQATEYFPLNCGKATGNQKAFSGSDGVMNFLTSSGANGAIGIEEYSFPLMKNYPSAKLLNSAGYFTLPTQYNVAVALTKAVINDEAHGYSASDPDYLLQKLDGVYTNPDARTYPLSSYVYAIIPTGANDTKTSTTAARQTVADFLYYSICQGQAEIGPIGYSSLPINLVQAGFAQIGKLKAADSGVVLTDRNVSTCNNPTFVAAHPEINHLAQIAPNPPACDKRGAGPCAAGVGSYNGNKPSDAKNGKGAHQGATKGTGTATAPASAPAAQDGSVVAPATGDAPAAADAGQADLGLGGTTAAGTTAGGGTVVATTLAADQHAGPSRALTALVVGLLLLVLVAPAVVGRLVRKAGR
jgi:ABC-type phosphate transport system substrate-binding protein